MIIMKEVLEANGFKLLWQCSCGGTHNMTFGKTVNLKSYEVTIRPSQKSFTISSSNTRIAAGKEDTLTQKLIENGIIKAV